MLRTSQAPTLGTIAFLGAALTRDARAYSRADHARPPRLLGRWLWGGAKEERSQSDPTHVGTLAAASGAVSARLDEQLQEIGADRGNVWGRARVLVARVVGRGEDMQHPTRRERDAIIKVRRVHEREGTRDSEYGRIGLIAQARAINRVAS